MVEADVLAQRERRVTLRTHDDAALLGIVVGEVDAIGAEIVPPRCGDRVVHLVPEPERGRLRAALGRHERAERVPADRVRVRVVGVVPVMVDHDAMWGPAVLEALDEGALP